MQSILWYDLETWNEPARVARIAQFAAIRTDIDFKPIEDPVVYHCLPAKDCVPSPHAILVHKLLPTALPMHNTLTEWDLLRRIMQMMQQPETIVSGYNSIRFDNEVLRFSWFRNALDAYAIDYREGARWDIIDTTRACHALRPDGIRWRKNEDPITSFKLEDLAVNNQLDQQQVHDALSDVRATIGMAKLLNAKQPKLYHFFFSHRDKRKIMQLLQLANNPVYHPTAHPPPMLVHISGMVPEHQLRGEVIMPVAFHPSYKNEVIAIGLKENPEQWLHLSVEEIRHRVFSKQTVLEEKNQQRCRIFTLRLKKLPAIAPLKVLQNDAQWQAIGHEKVACFQHYQIALKHFDSLREKLERLYQPDEAISSPEDTVDADLSLYQGFLSAKDKRLLTQFQHHMTTPKISLDGAFSMPIGLDFDNQHLHDIAFRMRARNFPETLSTQEKQQWQVYCQHVYDTGEATQYSLHECKQQLNELKETALTSDQQMLLQQFEQWLNEHTTF